ncbi:MAG TPA: hypothetical protein VMD55_05260, partial [Terracidiphilus sp.]|nr:hypothetical protein [Terracidiphilus sp.]
EVEARRLLLEAFAGECLDRMKPGAARDYAQAVIEVRLLSLAAPASAANSAGEHNQPNRERNWEEIG